jgi:alpha-tubulin suppressor-like RCC1 family protein
MRTELAHTFLDAGWTLARAVFAAVSALLLTPAARHAARAGFLRSRLFCAVACRGGLPAATRAAVLAFATVVIVSSAGTASAASAGEGAARGSVAAGYAHGCGVRGDGTLACWGDNTHGQALPPAGTFSQVSAGRAHSCAVNGDGTLACWGDNSWFQATPPTGTFSQVSASNAFSCGVKGDGTLACWGYDEQGQATPPAGTFNQVSAGNFHSCGVKSDGTLACWGYNGRGEATPPGGSFSSAAVDAGGRHNCAVQSDGAPACWGYGAHGQTSAPTAIFSQIAAGGFYSCGLKSDGTLACWGDNGGGQAAPPAGSFTQVSAGSVHTCGVKSDDGTLACWGYNFYGEATPPTGTFRQVSASNVHSCGVRSNGILACWGNNTSDKATPPAGTFSQVSAGSDHSCGVKSDGTLVCWGDNSYGQATPPTDTFRQVSAGYQHSCGVKSAGALACWGDNSFGRATPPAGIFSQVSVGDFHSCGVMSDATIACWGDNSYAQLGAAPSISNTPPAGTVGTAYNFAFSDGAAPAPTYEVASGSLPDGLSLSASGEISGTPTAAGTTPFTVRARNLLGSDAHAFSIEVSVADSTPPVVSYTLNPVSPGPGGWYRTPVTLTWSVNDPESTVTGRTGCVDGTVSSQQALSAYSCSATSAGGTRGPVTVSIGYDTTAPTFTPSLSAGSVFALGAPASAVTLTGLSDPDPDGAGPIVPSGIASSSCGTIATATIGKKTVSCTAADNAGNSTPTPVSYSVTYAFAGFQAPQPKSPQKKGSSIPVKFMLANYAGSTLYRNVTGLRAVISGPATATASCAYSATIDAYQCQVKLPNTVGTYVLTVQQQLGTDWVALANTASAAGTPNANGETVVLK